MNNIYGLILFYIYFLCFFEIINGKVVTIKNVVNLIKLPDILNNKLKRINIKFYVIKEFKYFIYPHQ